MSVRSRMLSSSSCRTTAVANVAKSCSSYRLTNLTVANAQVELATPCTLHSDIETFATSAQATNRFTSRWAAVANAHVPLTTSYISNLLNNCRACIANILNIFSSQWHTVANDHDVMLTPCAVSSVVISCSAALANAAKR
eukprot:gnl/TRDRNA2_/TRDRNA2_63127_c0_seq2.p1 gnl/TRDRNA2_/TRDRNA2_63127_c0~~gnl/TRDRNA2_/TRDRNA2_63127_c0_seq2.p1  ORF type:complete len:140 (-),score=11.15 gnl/TRDRNA2_/TRDRNA2_63127_c0_seq2:146-565(-)